MDIINFIFRLGVVFAIFSFLWWIIRLGIALLRSGRPRTLTEAYLLKFIRYFFLVDVTILFCWDHSEGFLARDKTIIAGLILLTYFLGKLQNAQFRTDFFKVQGAHNISFINNIKPMFNLKAEAFVIVLSLAIFTGLIFFPEFAANPISDWFYESIIDIEGTSVFGFIFKVIGFFFMLSIIMKFIQGFLTLLTGTTGNKDDDGDDDDHHFDNYQEIK